MHAEQQRNVSANCVEAIPALHLTSTCKQGGTEWSDICTYAFTTCSPSSFVLHLEIKEFVQSLRITSRTTRIQPCRESKKQHESKYCLQNPNFIMYAIDWILFLLYAVDRNKCLKDICKYKRDYPGRLWVQCTSCGQWCHCRCVGLTKMQAQQLKTWHCKNC